MDTKDITKGGAKKSYIEAFGRKIIDLGEKLRAVDIWYYDGLSMTKVEANANAELICEAFNVANETGLSPTQMMDRIKELENLLQYCVNSMKIADETEFSDEIHKAETALNKKQK